MALGSTKSLTEMSTRNISLGGGGGMEGRVKAVDAWDWQLYHLHVPIVLNPGSLNLLEPSGPVQGSLYVLPVWWDKVAANPEIHLKVQWIKTK